MPEQRPETQNNQNQAPNAPTRDNLVDAWLLGENPVGYQSQPLSKHAKHRLESKDKQRQLNPQTTKQNGLRYYDTLHHTLVIVEGRRVVVYDSFNETQVTQYKTSRKSIQYKIMSGRWQKL